MFAVSCNQPLTLTGAKTRVGQAFAALEEHAWQRYSCGDGDKGRRFYDWAWIQLDHTEWVLVRRSISDPADLVFYRYWATQPVALPELVRVAGSRWSVEETFQATNNEGGLDPYRVRKHTTWYRHITLALVAHSYLVFLAADPPAGQGETTGEVLADLGARARLKSAHGAKPRCNGCPICAAHSL